MVWYLLLDITVPGYVQLVAAFGKYVCNTVSLPIGMVAPEKLQQVNEHLQISDTTLEITWGFAIVLDPFQK